MKVIKIVLGLVALAMAIAFLAVPVIKLKSVALGIVILLGVAAMVVSFVEAVREKDLE